MGVHSPAQVCFASAAHADRLLASSPHPDGRNPGPLDTTFGSMSELSVQEPGGRTQVSRGTVCTDPYLLLKTTRQGET